MTEDTHDQEPAQSEQQNPAPKPAMGKIEWLDLTVADADRVKDFYSAVVGWSSNNVDMGHYDDYNMNLPGTQHTVAGVCHARGPNQNLPPQWLVYVRVASVAESAEKCTVKGGKVLDGPRRMGGSNFAVIQDPAGAVMALISD